MHSNNPFDEWTGDQTKSILAAVREVQEAREVAEAAPAVTAVDPSSGREVKHLHVRLSPADTRRVMSLPPEERAAMAEVVLAKRALIKKRNVAEQRALEKHRALRKKRRRDRKRAR